MLGIDIFDASLLPAMMIAVMAGVLSFLSPCVLPIVPPYLAYMGGISMNEMQAGGAAKERGAQRMQQELQQARQRLHETQAAVEERRAEAAFASQRAKLFVLVRVLFSLSDFLCCPQIDIRYKCSSSF